MAIIVQRLKFILKKLINRWGIRPGVDPENLLFQTWFQLTISCIIGGVVVGMMAYHSGGRVTVNHRTYRKAHPVLSNSMIATFAPPSRNAKSRKMTAGPVAGAAVAEAVSREAVTHTAAAAAPFR